MNLPRDVNRIYRYLTSVCRTAPGPASSSRSIPPILPASPAWHRSTANRAGLDDEGKPMECSADPMLETLQAQLALVKLGEPDSASDEVLAPILSNPALFAVDLCQAGLAEA